MSYHYHRAQRERYQRKAQKLKEKQKKRQLMRESDFDKLPKELLARYDVTFKPFTRNYFEPAHIEKLINLGDKEYAKNPTGGHWAE